MYKSSCNITQLTLRINKVSDSDASLRSHSETARLCILGEVTSFVGGFFADFAGISGGRFKITFLSAHSANPYGIPWSQKS